jgi:oxygen-independent coproporphyrinogen III oxidase
MAPTTTLSFDIDRIRRYDRDGPRHTSYPTARQFTDRVAPRTYERAAALSRGARERQPLSAYLHMPFCFTPCFYCACNRIITHQLDHVDTYVRHLLREISLRSQYFDRTRVIDQMHFGGGTPTFLARKLLIEIIDRLDREFRLSSAEDRDYSIEIDPRGADLGMLQLLAGLGFNRISLGVQDFDETVQRAVNRVQPEATVTIRWLERRNGARCIADISHSPPWADC